MKLRPEKEKTRGGIIIPDNINDKLQQATTFATVIDIGPTCWHDCGGSEVWCKVGDVISFNKYSYRDVSYEVDSEGNPIEDEKLFKMINDKDVIGVYTNE